MKVFEIISEGRKVDKEYEREFGSIADKSLSNFDRQQLFQRRADAYTDENRLIRDREESTLKKLANEGKIVRSTDTKWLALPDPERAKYLYLNNMGNSSWYISMDDEHKVFREKLTQWLAKMHSRSSRIILMKRDLERRMKGLRSAETRKTGRIYGRTRSRSRRFR